jgi:hypothetical protein
MRALRPASIVLAMIAIAWIPSNDADAQAIQLPTVRVFQYSGSVLVPDRGTASLGGVSSTAFSSRRAGLGFPAGSKAAGRSAGTSNAIASATIIDLAEMDRQIRAGDLRKESARQNQVQAKRDEEGKRLVRYARTEYHRGNLAASRHGYELAISVLDGRLRDLAIAEFRRVHPSIR